MKHVNSFADYTADELKGILLLAEKIKQNQQAFDEENNKRLKMIDAREIVSIYWMGRNCIRCLKKRRTGRIYRLISAWKNWGASPITSSGKTVILRLVIFPVK